LVIERLQHQERLRFGKVQTMTQLVSKAEVAKLDITLWRVSGGPGNLVHPPTESARRLLDGEVLARTHKGREQELM